MADFFSKITGEKLIEVLFYGLFVAVVIQLFGLAARRTGKLLMRSGSRLAILYRRKLLRKARRYARNEYTFDVLKLSQTVAFQGTILSLTTGALVTGLLVLLHRNGTEESSREYVGIMVAAICFIIAFVGQIEWSYRSFLMTVCVRLRLRRQARLRRRMKHQGRLAGAMTVVPSRTPLGLPRRPQDSH